METLALQRLMAAIEQDIPVAMATVTGIQGASPALCGWHNAWGSSRINETGERRVTIFRYGVSWGATRYGYEYSQALLDRLTPERRKLLQPIVPSWPSMP